jgi:hypothetical protein
MNIHTWTQKFLSSGVYGRVDKPVELSSEGNEPDYKNGITYVNNMALLGKRKFLHTRTA